MANFGRAAVASLLAVAAAAKAAAAVPAPEAGPGSPADVCAIAARPEAPGYDQTDDPEKGARADAIFRATDWRIGGWDYKVKIRPEWGHCPIGSVRFSSLSFSPDGRYALTEGGWQAGPIEGGQGHCVFEKIGKAWALVACAITAIS
ncbi:MAG TPA: hypothetical protein VFZ91_11325 [Allosphingosinicella sp.]